MKDITIFGITLKDTDMNHALEMICTKIESGTKTVIYFINTNTLNVAHKDPGYRKVLNTADYVFGDGTGVRIAVSALGKEKLTDNVNGTDLTPALLNRKPKERPSCFILGATPGEIAGAADFFTQNFPRWDLAGYHHGYIAGDEKKSMEAVSKINQVKPDLLLVGMGNPIQEKWIAEYKDRIQATVLMGTGGLFTYWAGNLDRAPRWMRKIGIEWVHILRRQPKKWKRYLFGNLSFLFRVYKTKILN